MTEHVSITDPNIHEPKGASTASSGQILVANGSGGTSWQTPTFSYVEVGWYDYNDVTTATTPIALTTPGTYYTLTNDGGGVNTKVTYGISGIPNIWNTATNRLDFTGLELGDTLEIRADIDVTTTNINTAVNLVLELATGTGNEVDIPLINNNNIKAASTVHYVANVGFYIGSALIKDSPARIKASADTAGATVKVRGWYIRVIKRA